MASSVEDLLLPEDEREADQWDRSGMQHPVPIWDALLAATGGRGWTLVSRDEGGFRNTGVPVLNPFTKAPQR